MTRIAVAMLMLLGAGETLPAQQVSVRTPMMGSSDGFYEHFNVGWGFRRQSPRGSMFFSFGAPAFPPFGGYDPNADARFGLASRWGNGNFSFNFTAGQGSTRTTTMTAPSLTTMNGVPGSIRDTTIRPFVTGLIPVVGDYPIFPVYPIYPSFAPSAPVLISPLTGKMERLQQERSLGRNQNRQPNDELNLGADDEPRLPAAPAKENRPSTAEQGDIGVEEIRRQQAARQSEQQIELNRLIAEAREAEQAGALAIARVRYHQAAAKANGEQRKALLASASRLQQKQ